MIYFCLVTAKTILQVFHMMSTVYFLSMRSIQASYLSLPPTIDAMPMYNGMPNPNWWWICQAIASTITALYRPTHGGRRGGGRGRGEGALVLSVPVLHPWVASFSGPSNNYRSLHRRWTAITQPCVGPHSLSLSLSLHTDNYKPPTREAAGSGGQQKTGGKKSANSSETSQTAVWLTDQDGGLEINFLLCRLCRVKYKPRQFC